MATNVIMPVLGVSQDSGKVLQWYKKEGQAVQKGEPLLEVETDKAVLDIEAPASGTLVRCSGGRWSGSTSDGSDCDYSG